jgi:hypothetical protein
MEALGVRMEAAIAAADPAVLVDELGAKGLELMLKGKWATSDGVGVSSRRGDCDRGGDTENGVEFSNGSRSYSATHCGFGAWRGFITSISAFGDHF